MAISMHQANGNELVELGKVIASRKRQERDITQSERESRRSAGVALQNKQKELDYAMEQTKLHESNTYRTAAMRAGFDLQMKQLGVDYELQVQKLRNFNALELAEFSRVTSQMLKRMDAKNEQAAIIKQYQANLKLAKFNQKAALIKTFNDTMGDIFKHGDPASNAVDALAYQMWILAFKYVLGTANPLEPIDDLSDEVAAGDLLKEVNLDGESVLPDSPELQKLQELLKSIAENGGIPNGKGKQKKERKYFKAGSDSPTNWSKVQTKTGLKMLKNRVTGKVEKR